MRCRPMPRQRDERDWCQDNIRSRTKAVTAPSGADRAGNVGQERASLSSPTMLQACRGLCRCHACVQDGFANHSGVGDDRGFGLPLVDTHRYRTRPSLSSASIKSSAWPGSAPQLPSLALLDADSAWRSARSQRQCNLEAGKGATDKGSFPSPHVLHLGGIVTCLGPESPQSSAHPAKLRTWNIPRRNIGFPFPSARRATRPLTF